MPQFNRFDVVALCLLVFGCLYPFVVPSSEGLIRHVAFIALCGVVAKNTWAFGRGRTVYSGIGPPQLPTDSRGARLFVFLLNWIFLLAMLVIDYVRL
jgi:hypothetical protein